MIGYAVVQWLHVVAAAIAVGANATYALWFARSKARPEVVPFTLATIRFIDNRLANPAYGVLAVTGVIMLFIGPYAMTTPWIVASSAIFVALGIIAFGVYTPLLRRQVALAESGQVGSPQYLALSRRGRMIGPFLGTLALSIVFLMVAGPLLWP